MVRVLLADAARLGQGVRFRYHTDNMPLVEGWRKKRWQRAVGTNADLWRLVRLQVQRTGEAAIEPEI